MNAIAVSTALMAGLWATGAFAQPRPVAAGAFTADSEWLLLADLPLQSDRMTSGEPAGIKADSADRTADIWSPTVSFGNRPSGGRGIFGRDERRTPVLGEHGNSSAKARAGSTIASRILITSEQQAATQAGANVHPDHHTKLTILSLR